MSAWHCVLLHDKFYLPEIKVSFFPIGIPHSSSLQISVKEIFTKRGGRFVLISDQFMMSKFMAGTR